MATFEIEHRINQRQRELDEARRSRLARRGIDEAMQFARRRPMIITPDRGQIPDSAFRRGAGFANVRSRADTVPGREAAQEVSSGGPRRRGALQMSAAPGAAPVDAPRLRRSPEAEAERKQRIRDIDSALFDLRARGGGLNMASKRRLYGQLLGEKNDLTSQNFDVQNQRAIEQARIQNDVAQGNANRAERAAERRDMASRFGAELGDRRFEFDTNRRDAYDAAIAAAPRNELEMEKLRTEIDVNKANALRAADEYTRKAPSIGDDVLEPRIEALMAQGLTYPDARAQAVAAYQASGADAEASTIGQENRQALARRLGEAFNPKNIPLLDWRTIGDEAAIGSSLSPDQVPAGAIDDPRAVRATRLGALRRILTPGADYRFEVQGPKGKRAVYSDDEDLFNAIQEYQRALPSR